MNDKSRELYIEYLNSLSLNELYIDRENLAEGKQHDLYIEYLKSLPLDIIKYQDYIKICAVVTTDKRERFIEQYNLIYERINYLEHNDENSLFSD